MGILTGVFHCSYTGYIETNYGWILWEKKTWTGSSRAPTVVTAAASPVECPVIWRRWPSNNLTIGMRIAGEIIRTKTEDLAFILLDLVNCLKATNVGPWTASMYNTEGSNEAGNAIDNDETSLAQTQTNYNYPYLAIDLGRCSLL